METTQVNKEEVINKEELSKMSSDGFFLLALLLFILSSGQSFGGYPCPIQGYTQPPICININSNNVNDPKEENKENA